MIEILLLGGGALVVLAIIVAVVLYLKNRGGAGGGGDGGGGGGGGTTPNTSLKDEVPQISKVVVGESVDDVVGSPYFSSIYPYATVKTQAGTASRPLAPGPTPVIILYYDATLTVTAVDAADSVNGPAVPAQSLAGAQFAVPVPRKKK